MSEATTAPTGGEINTSAVNLIDVVNSPAASDPAAEAPAKTEAPAADATGWMLAPGVPGEGTKPDFYNEKTYGTLMDQAKAHPELLSTHGKLVAELQENKISKNVAPDAYDFEVDTVEGQAPVIPDGDKAFLGEFSKVCKEHNISQDGFTGMLDFYKGYLKTEAEEGKIQRDTAVRAELDKMGGEKEAKIKLDKLDARMAQTFPEELQAAAKSLITNADQFKIMEYITKQLVPQRLPSTDMTLHPEAPDRATLLAEGKAGMQLARYKDNKDPAFRAFIDGKYRAASKLGQKPDMSAERDFMRNLPKTQL